MKNYIPFAFLLTLMGCFSEERNVGGADIPGFYLRKSSELEETICINSIDSSYTYTMKRGNESKVVSSGKWDFYVIQGMSRVMFDKFKLDNRGTEINTSLSVIYSEVKEAVVLRVDPDSHYKDFIKGVGTCK